MPRSRVYPVKQPDENSCGPTALKTALAILGKRASVAELIELCQTNRNGTTTRNMLKAIRKLKLPSLVMEKTTLHHLLSALKPSPAKKRAVLVSYLYAMDENNNPKPDSGHWAVVSSYKPATGRIVVLDSYSGQKVSYPWTEFRRRWTDKTLKRRKTGKTKASYTLIKKEERQLMIVLSDRAEHLPRFGIATAEVIKPKRTN